MVVEERERKMILQKFYDGKYTISYWAHRAVVYTRAYVRVDLSIWDIEERKRKGIVLWSARVEQIDHLQVGKVEQNGHGHGCHGRTIFRKK